MLRLISLAATDTAGPPCSGVSGAWRHLLDNQRAHHVVLQDVAVPYVLIPARARTGRNGERHLRPREHLPLPALDGTSSAMGRLQARTSSARSMMNPTRGVCYYSPDNIDLSFVLSSHLSILPLFW